MSLCLFEYLKKKNLSAQQVKRVGSIQNTCDNCEMAALITTPASSVFIPYRSLIQWPYTVEKENKAAQFIKNIQ